MDILSAIMILVPLLAPMALVCGIDPIHLGIVFIVNLELGYLTPPMGLNLFVSSSIFEKSLGDVIKSVVPFTGLLLIAVILVTYVPTISLGPVNLFKGRDFYVPFPSGDVCETVASGDDDDLEGGDDGSGKSIKDLMQGGSYDDAFGDDDDDDDDDPSAKSIKDLMKGGGYGDAFDDDDDDDAPPAVAPKSAATDDADAPPAVAPKSAATDDADAPPAVAPKGAATDDSVPKSIIGIE
jgi:C4-dicarboxylate transporter DctM subunit